MTPRTLGCGGVPGHYLRHGVGRGVHELAEVDHALALVLGDVDGLDGGEAGVGIPKILQLQPPLHQAQVGPFHKNLRRKETIRDHPAAPTGTGTRAMHREEGRSMGQMDHLQKNSLFPIHSGFVSLVRCRMMLG